MIHWSSGNAYSKFEPSMIFSCWVTLSTEPLVVHQCLSKWDSRLSSSLVIPYQWVAATNQRHPWRHETTDTSAGRSLPVSIIFDGYGNSHVKSTWTPCNSRSALLVLVDSTTAMLFYMACPNEVSALNRACAMPLLGLHLVSRRVWPRPPGTEGAALVTMQSSTRFNT